MAEGIVIPGAVVTIELTLMENGTIRMSGPLHDPIMFNGLLTTALQNYALVRANGMKGVVDTSKVPPPPLVKT